MLKFRIAARLDIRNTSLVKTIRCEGVRKIGDPHEHARRYEASGIDEMVYLDLVSSLYARGSLAHLVERAAGELMTPFSVGGGVRSLEDARALLNAGADKIAVNTAAVRHPGLLAEIAEKVGRQSVVLQLDAKRKGASWEAYCEGARQPTGRDAIAWAKEAVRHGAGEILVTSIDREGTGRGFDLDLVGAVVGAVGVPVVVAGGFGAAAHAVQAARAGASGIAVAGALHYGRLSPAEIRAALSAAGIAVRQAV